MEGSLNNREKRRCPRMLINLPLEYQDMGDSCLRGAMVVNAGDGGLLIESTRNIPVGTRLKVTLLFSKGFELADFKAVTQIVRKEPYSKKDLKGDQCWGGYQYGLEVVQISDEDRWKLTSLIGGQFESEKNPPSQSHQL